MNEEELDEFIEKEEEEARKNDEGIAGSDNDSDSDA